VPAKIFEGIFKSAGKNIRRHLQKCRQKYSKASSKVPAKIFDDIFKSAGKKIQRHLLKMPLKRFCGIFKKCRK
jgi:hypothetical protein